MYTILYHLRSSLLNRITHLIIIMAASQLHFLANENAELAGPASKLHKSA